jgi:steroid 5-alpha reductase family enzyme
MFDSILGILLFSALFCFVWMSLVWLMALRWNNFSIVDAAWALNFFLITAFLSGIAPGAASQKTLALVAIGVWSLRLFYFLARRISRHHPHEDVRYIDLRKEYGASQNFRFFLFFQYQAISVVLLSVPAFALTFESRETISLSQWIGLALVIFSVLGEAIADEQKAAHKRQTHPARVNCEVGLWKYSRHPNYFFESLVWFGFALVAWDTTFGTWALTCPVLMLLLLLKVTGVPLSEKNGLTTYGQAYVDYQKRTSLFVPWFTKPSGKSLSAALLILTSAGALIDSHSSEAAPFEPKNKTAVIRSLDLKKTLFQLKTTYETGPDQVITSQTVIQTPEGELAMSETAKYLNGKLISQNVKQHQTGEEYWVQVQGDQVILKDKKSEKKMSREENFLTGPLSEDFLARNWETLKEKKPVYARFGVLELLDTVGFVFRWKEETKIGERAVTKLSMGPSSFFISLALKEIDLYMDSQTRRMIRFVGRTPLMQKNSSGKLVHLDAQIDYQYD